VTGFDAAFATFAVGLTSTPEAAVTVRAAVDAVRTRLARGARAAYVLAERHKAGTALFGEDTYHRLQQVKATYHSVNLIRSNCPVLSPDLLAVRLGRLRTGRSLRPQPRAA